MRNFHDYKPQLPKGSIIIHNWETVAGETAALASGRDIERYWVYPQADGLSMCARTGDIGTQTYTAIDQSTQTD